MSILFCSPTDSPEPWREAFARAFPGMAFRTFPDAGPLDDVRYALAWNPPPGLLARLSNVRAILWLGAGVDRLLADPALPPEVPIVRLVDAGFPQSMAEYALYAILHFQRRMGEYARQQGTASWRPLEEPLARDWPVGVLGLGTIGAVVARHVAQAGFPVMGWSRTPSTIPGVQAHAGRDGLGIVLARCRVLINVLPLTPETSCILDARAFAAMPRGACIVNIGRGGHVVDEDLLEALASGRLAGAMLDVFREEPLPVDHPFWRHPKIIVTPHVAAVTVASAAQTQVIENVMRLERGEPPLGVVDRERGY